MILPIILGVVEVVVNMLIQATTVTVILRHLARIERAADRPATLFAHTSLLARIMVVLFLGHMLQILAWAIPFRLAGQFNDLTTAFYHSAVNYTTLGYGDIVMDGRWRLVAALEAANGILMFGVSTAVFFAIMSAELRQRSQLFQRSK